MAPDGANPIRQADDRPAVIVRAARWRAGAAFWALVLLVLPAVAAVGYVAGQRTLVESPLLTVLDVTDDSQLHVGTHWAASEVPWTLTLENPTPFEVAVSDVEVSCACVRVLRPQFAVPSGGTAEVPLLVDLTPFAEYGGDGEYEPLSVDLTARLSAAGVADPTWTLTAVVRYAFRGPREFEVFEPPLVARGSVEPIEVVIEPLVELAELRLVPRDDVSATAAVSLQGDNDRYVITVTPTALAPGNWEVVLDLVAVLPTGEALPRSPLRVHADVEGDVAAMPGAVALTGAAGASAGDHTVTLASQSGDPFAITQCECPAGMSVDGIAAGASAPRHVLDVRLSDVREGPTEGEIRLHARFDDGTEEVVSIAVTLYGTEATARSRQQPSRAGPATDGAEQG